MADPAHDPIVIVGTARTAISGFQGAFAPLTAPHGAGLPGPMPCTTVNKMCGSGMRPA